ncbi:LacI family DNA-binding transcriptional regulator [Altericroceibacterium xinjiangense]|uniref:LacI family DNA-binding transcriptional regulator n=1 Tax=Altericroceibacterium xinjiangense TaxID=762261 RepID=UPI000F7F015D|nr:LacI family DNA-binding transcriptional regulator [Altericroceibacterium xinjiangense]
MSRVTIIDIARHANTSFKTVSRVINGSTEVTPETRERVEKSMRELNYRPSRAAQSLRGKRAYNLCFAFSMPPGPEAGDPFLRDMPPFLTEVIAGMLRACSKAQFQLTIEGLDTESPDARTGAALLLDNLEIDGMVLCPPVCDVPWLLELLRERRIAFARIAAGTEFPHATSLWIDDFAAAEQIGRVLVGLGHTRIGHISGPAHHLRAQDRTAGLKAALEEAGAAAPRVREGDFSFDGGMREGCAMLDTKDRPTAIFAANDRMAAGVIAAAAALDIKVPEQLSVVGFDDSPIARFTRPAITTINQNVWEMGYRAASHLIQHAGTDVPAPAQSWVLPYEYVERESVAPAP